MKKIIILLMGIFLMTGCSDYVEINELAVTTGMALDYKNNEFVVTIQVIDSQSESEQNKMITFEAKAESIDKALGKLSKLVNKKIFISHLKAVILSPEIIENDVNYYDYFLRDPKSKMNFFIYVPADEIKPNEILESQTKSEVSSMYLDSMLSFNEDVYSSSVQLKFFNLILDTLDEGKNIVYPVIDFKDREKKEDIILKSLVTYNYKNEKLILDEQESIIYNILTNNAKETVIDISCGEKTFSLSIDEAGTKFDWKDKVFNIETSLTSAIGSYECDMPLGEESTEKHLNKLANEHISKSIEALVNKAKDNENDFLGIGNYIYKFDYDYFNSLNGPWDANVKKLDIKTKLDLKIISKGEARFNAKGES